MRGSAEITIHTYSSHIGIDSCHPPLDRAIANYSETSGNGMNDISGRKSEFIILRSRGKIAALSILSVVDETIAHTTHDKIKARSCQTLSQSFDRCLPFGVASRLGGHAIANGSADCMAQELLPRAWSARRPS